MSETSHPESGFELTPPKILLMGGAGTGKTTAIGTLVDWVSENIPDGRVFALFTENGLETLIKYFTDRNKPIPACLHWHVVKTSTAGLLSLQAAAELVGKSTYESLAKSVDSRRARNNVFARIITILGDFQDQRTGKNFGAADVDWTEKDFLAVDGLTELSHCAMKMQIGTKPTANLPDYMIAQVNLMNLLRLLVNGTRCGLLMTAHPVREKDELTGAVKLMPRTIGSAIASELAPLFSEVILTVRDGDKWFWDTQNSSADLKTRYLPISSKLSPDVTQILNGWSKAAAAARTGNLEEVQ